MSEIRCLEDMDQFGAETDDALEDLSQDLFHRLIEAPGSNIDDPARGLGLERRLSSSGREGALSSSLRTDIEAEMRKDSRVQEANASVTETAPGAYEIHIQIVADEGDLGIKLVADGDGVRRVA